MSRAFVLRSASSALGVALSLSIGPAAHAGLINGGFETTGVAVPDGTFSLLDASQVAGWHTTATDNLIEIWGNNFNGGAGPTPAYEGHHFAELNATQVATLYQDATGIAAGQTVGFQFAHRGRLGVDTMRLTITDLGIDGVLGGGDDTVLFSQSYSDDNTAWGFYTSAGEPTITTLGDTIRFSYESVSAAGGNQTEGNLIDAADFGVGVGTTVPEPASLLLVGLSLGLMAAIRRQRTL